MTSRIPIINDSNVRAAVLQAARDAGGTRQARDLQWTPDLEAKIASDNGVSAAQVRAMAVELGVTRFEELREGALRLGAEGDARPSEGQRTGPAASMLGARRGEIPESVGGWRVGMRGFHSNNVTPNPIPYRTDDYPVVVSVDTGERTVTFEGRVSGAQQQWIVPESLLQFLTHA
ncbi:MAG: hypothetical protein IT384_15995 [Deltaproteobacteria bacterium]|nr:hypothetical protein [Deltaproteobacteria bacterium]